jgi:hypothetical protein
MRIAYQNQSVNWSKYGKPWDVIFDFPGHGFAQFLVGDLPTELPSQKTENAKPHSFFPSHVPECRNYSHCEIWTFKDGVPISKSTKLPATVKKEFRQIISDRAVILRTPLL